LTSIPPDEVTEDAAPAERRSRTPRAVSSAGDKSPAPPPRGRAAVPAPAVAVEPAPDGPPSNGDGDPGTELADLAPAPEPEPTVVAPTPLEPAYDAWDADDDLTPLPRLSKREQRRYAHAAPTASMAPREFRQTVTRVDLWSVTKLALCFYISSMFVMIVALVALWLLADSAGVVHSVEKFIGDLVESKNFHFLSGDVLRGVVLVGVVVVLLQIVVTVIAASFYNIFAELFGGLEITIKEESETTGY